MTPVAYIICSFCRLYWKADIEHFPWFQTVPSSDSETRTVLLVKSDNSVVTQIFLILSEKNEVSSCLSSSCFSYFPILWSLFMKPVSVVSVSSISHDTARRKTELSGEWGWLQSPESNHLSLHWSARNITWNQCNTAQNTVYWEVKKKRFRVLWTSHLFVKNNDLLTLSSNLNLTQPDERSVGIQQEFITYTVVGSCCIKGIHHILTGLKDSLRYF